MKKIDQIMKEMGFNKEAPDSVKEAFIKHLIRSSEGTNVITPSEKREIELSYQKVRKLATFEQALRKQNEQLAFDFIDETLLKPSKRNA